MPLRRHYDFYSPFMAAWIITDPDRPDGTRFPLWVEGVSPDRRNIIAPKSTDGSTDYAQIEALTSLAFCTEVSVELQLAFVPRITATLTPPLAEGLAFLNSTLIEWGNSILEVQFGYTGGIEGVVLSPVFSGVLLKPSVTIGKDITITLNAQGIGAFTAARQDAVSPFSGKTRRKIIQELAQRVGLEAIFDEVDAPFEKELASTSRQVFETLGNSLDSFQLDQVTARELEAARKKIYRDVPLEQVVSVSPAGMTIWQMLYQLVRESRCWMFVQGSDRPGGSERLCIVPRNSVMTGEPHCLLVLYDIPDGEIGPAKNVYPIENVSSPTSAIYLPSATRGFLVFGYDSKERAKAVQIVDPNAQDVQRSGRAQTQANASRNNPPADLKKAEGMAVASNNSLNSEANEQILAESEAAATNMGVKLDIDTLGIPDILPAHVVGVRGIGSRFEGGSGNYGVLKVVHTLGASAYTTKLEVVSNVGQLAGTFDKDTLPKTQTNEHKPQVDSAATSDKVTRFAKKAR